MPAASPDKSSKPDRRIAFSIPPELEDAFSRAKRQLGLASNADVAQIATLFAVENTVAGRLVNLGNRLVPAVNGVPIVPAEDPAGQAAA